jgi:hypothetical protein
LNLCNLSGVCSGSVLGERFDFEESLEHLTYVHRE